MGQRDDELDEFDRDRDRGLQSGCRYGYGVRRLRSADARDGRPVTVDAGGIQLTGTVQFRAVGDFSTYTITGGNLTTAVGGTTFDVIDVSASAATDATIASVITGGNGVSKTGVGTLTLSGTNIYTGATTISGGTL